MELEKLSHVMEFYVRHSILKETERKGWIKWNVTGRRESIADHISSAQALAWALYSEFDLNVNIEHVISLLSLHEEGETLIGDITPYEGITPEEKLEKEREAIVSIYKDLKQGKYLISLFDEFEARKTTEAQFAYLCDKLDCDLQAMFYSDEERCTIANATYEMVSNKQVQQIIQKGAKTVWEVFYEADKHIYEGTFLEEFFHELMNS